MGLSIINGALDLKRFKAEKSRLIRCKGICVALFLICGAPSGLCEKEKWEAPPRAARRANPVAANPSSVARGKDLYLQECAACHGLTGNGDGARVKEINVTPSDLSNPSVHNQSDGALFWKISEGKSPMLPFRMRFSEKERWMIVNYLRTLAVRPTGRVSAGKSAIETNAQQIVQSNALAADSSSMARGKELYVQECAACHGSAGKGDGPRASELKVDAADLSSPAVQKQSDRVLFSKITEGKKPMPAFGSKLQDKDLWMVIGYVRTLGTKESGTPPGPSFSKDPANPPGDRTSLNPVYLHVLVNPMPIYGLSLATVALFVGLLMRNRPMQLLALWLILLCSASAWLADFLGHKAYHQVYQMSDGEGQHWLALHMHRADKVIYLFYALAAAALATALVPRRVPKLRLPLAILTLTLTVFCMGGGAWIAKAGGKVRHQEFRTHAPSQPAQNENGHPGLEPPSPDS